MGKSKIATQLLAGFAATISGLSAGVQYGWAAPSLPKLIAEDSDISITSDESSWIVSFLPLGSIFGGFVGVALFDRCGRKFSLLFTAVPVLISWILTGIAQSYWCLLVARFIAGMGIGIIYTVAPMYLGEIADDRIRGALGTMLTLMFNAGILLAYCIGPWVSRIAFACFGGGVSVVFGLMFVWMPDSPYYLIMKGKPDLAEKCLVWLKRVRSVSDDVKKLQDSVDFDKKNAASVKDLLFVAGNRKALVIVVGLLFAQQLSGIGAVLAYGSTIFEASGSTIDSSISVIIIGAIQLLSTMLTTFTVDLAGRRSLLLLSAGGSILFLSGEALYFQLQATGSDLSMISWLPLTAIVGYIICYTIGFGSLPYVVISEIFAGNVKAPAAMIASNAGSVGSIVIMKLYQVVADEYGIHVSFWGFVGITIFSAIFIYFILPETKQRSLKSIQEELHKTTEYKVGLRRSEVA